MKITIIDNGTRYLPDLQRLLHEHQVTTTPFESLQSTQSFPSDLVVLSGGSRVSFFDEPDSFAGEIEFIKHTTTPLIGVCLGFELIASAFGATLKKQAAQEKGLLEITALQQDSVFNGREKFTVYENHRIVVESLPPTLIALASSKDGIEAIRHASLPIYGFQFHPEVFTDSTYGDEVFLAAVRTLGKALVAHR